MEYTKYEKYKDSGLDWLGEIPDGWELNHLKRYCKNITDGAHTSPDTSSNDFPFLTVVDLKKGELDFNNCLFTSQKDYKTLVRNGCKPKLNDVLYSKDGTIGETVVINFERNFVVGSSFIIIKPILKRYYPKYLKYLLASSIMQYQARIYVKGAGLPRISIFNLSKLLLPIPCVRIQVSIAQYLDEKTAQIDKKIELLLAKKEKYQELRKTIINEAVTKGIDKTVELKDSGVQWLGKIPKYWEIKRGKDIFKEESRKGYGDQPLLAASQKLGVVLKSKLEQRSMEATKNFDDFKYVKKGEFVISLRSFEGGIEIAHDSGIISPAYTVFSLDKNFSNDYFKHLLKSDQFICFLRSFITGIRDGQTIRFKEVGNMPFPTAPKFEQKRIADYLDEKTSKIDEIVKTIDKNIEVLNEFRKTLINDAVTGKIKIVSSENTPYERTAITG